MIPKRSSLLSDLDRARLTDITERYTDSFRDPEVVAGKVAEWAKKHLPDRVSAALWVTAEGTEDEGIFVRFRELTLKETLKVRLGGLIGSWSAGLAAVTDIWRGEGGISAYAGIGAVVPFADPRAVAPVLVVQVSW